jgi:serine/threonine-protein kinase
MAELSDHETDGELVFDEELLDDYAPTRVSIDRQRELAQLSRPPGRRAYPHEVRPGDLLAGKYRVERVHRGSVLGVTFEAQHLQLGVRVALRLLAADHDAYPEASARFLRGARLAVQFQNDHTARLLDVGTLESGVPYVVAEFLAGSDLQRVLRVREALTVPEAVDYLLQACEGLAEAHAHTIVHRNLKPSNLFLTRMDGAKRLAVLDFGVSDDPLTDATINLGGTQGAMKAFAYLAPEQIREPATVDARADIWALGAILHEMLSGVPLFDGATTPALLAMIAADPAPPVSHLRPEIPAGLEAVVLRCVAKDRQERYPNLAELASALSPFASTEGLRSVDRISKVSARRARSAQPPQLPGQQRSHAIVHVRRPPVSVEVQTPDSAARRRWSELALTGLGFAFAGALGVFVAVHMMEGALISALAPRAVVADLSPALPAPVALTAVSPAALAPALQTPAPALQTQQAVPLPAAGAVVAALAPQIPQPKAAVVGTSQPPLMPPLARVAVVAPRRSTVAKITRVDAAAVADAKPAPSKVATGPGLFDDAN